MNSSSYTSADRVSCYWLLRQWRHRTATDLWRTPLRDIPRRANLNRTLTKLDHLLGGTHEILRSFNGEDGTHALRGL